MYTHRGASAQGWLGEVKVQATPPGIEDWSEGWLSVAEFQAAVEALAREEAHRG